MSFEGGGGASKQKKTTKETSTQAREGVRTEQLQLEQAAIDKIVQDVLGGSGGLKEIFGVS